MPWETESWYHATMNYFLEKWYIADFLAFVNMLNKALSGASADTKLNLIGMQLIGYN